MSKDRPGKNPGENLCRETVMTLDVKLKASSTPEGKKTKKKCCYQGAIDDSFNLYTYIK